MAEIVRAPDGSIYESHSTLFAVNHEKPTVKQLHNLPRSKFAGNAMWHAGGPIPVREDAKISVWLGAFDGAWERRGYWKGLPRAGRHDWSKPCVYRLRESALRSEATMYKRSRILAIVRQLQRYAEELETLA